MNNTPSLQRKIFGLNSYFDEIIRLFELNKLPNKILLSGPKGSGKSTLAYHLINYIFSKDEVDKYNINKNEIIPENRSFKLISSNSHTNFYLIDLIDDKKNIEISQIRKMIEYSNLSSFNNQPKFILINNVENLNPNSLNALLKIIEEPNENLYFFLIHNINKNILKTLKSRCLQFKIHLEFNKSLQITNQILDQNVLEIINHDLINYYNSPGDYINLIKFSKENLIDIKNINLSEFIDILIAQNYYKKNDFIKYSIFNFIELYFLKIYNSTNNKNKLITFYNYFVKKTNETNKFNLDVESLLMEVKSKILHG